MEENTKKIFVVDASFVLAFLLKEDVKIVDDVFERYKNNLIEIVSCDLLNYEIGNGLRMAVVRKRLEKNKATIIYQQFLNLKIPLKPINFYQVLKTALSKKLTFYDAAYHTLAKSLSVKILTLD